MGYNQPIQGASPPGGYGYYYLNEPNYFHTNVTLRLAFAGVYLDSETGFVGLLGPHTDFGLGLGGGGFVDDYYEIQQGHYIEGQSFFGHAAEGSASVYHLFNPGSRIPLNGVFRIREHYSVFARDETNPNFALPSDHSTVAWRAGLRWGGREPLLYPNTAMEISAWYEGQYRTDSGPYGFGGDRLLNQMSELYWARALLIYTFPNSQQSFDVSFNAGGSGSADRFSAYRLGGDLPLMSEFPLMIPGYFQNELSARNFACFSAKYTLPLDGAKRWSLTPMGSVATVDYLPGLAQPGHFNSGVGIGAGYRSRSGVWQATLDYGYGFEAVRTSGRGGQSIEFMLQINLGARHPNGPSLLDSATDFMRNHL
jgi:hypothetical protein